MLWTHQRQMRNVLLLQGDVHRSWVHAESLLSPVFDGLPANQKHLTLLQQVMRPYLVHEIFKH